MANVKFKSGEVAALSQSIDNGTLFATTDSKELYIDIEDQRIALPNKDTVNTAISGKQDQLVSGTNIKTINGSSILTSGNINASEVSVSSSGTSTTEAKYITVNNTEYKIGGGIIYEIVREPWDTTPMTSAEATAAGLTWGMEV